MDLDSGTTAGTTQLFRYLGPAKVLRFGAAAILVAGTAVANEALDLLEADPGSGIGSVATSGPDPAVARGAEKARLRKVDPTLPGRWDTELPPRFQIHLPEPQALVSAIAPRGLFEWRMESGEIEWDTGGESKIDSSRMRRARLGLALLAYYDTELLVEGLFDGGGSYRGLESLKVRIPVGEAMALTLGKFPPPFTLDYSRDAAVRWFPELPPLVAQIVPANSLGALIEGAGTNWDWKAGWFSGDADRDVPAFDGNGFALAGVGYSFNGPTGEEGGGTGYQRWHLDYIHNFDRMRSESVPNGYRHLVATGMQVSSGRFDLEGDFMLARGEAASVWGMSLAGGCWLMEDALRMVVRYDYAASDDPGGVMSGWGVPASGSDAVQPFGFPEVWTGERLHSIYTGLNIHLLEDNLILSSGVEFRSMSGVAGGARGKLDAWIWESGGRVAF